jgi:hypothetical protein
VRLWLLFTRCKDAKSVMLDSTLDFVLDVGYIAVFFSGFSQSRKVNSGEVRVKSFQILI